MAKATDVLKIAKSQIGYKESPAGSNKTKYGKEYGMNGQPWCAMFVWWCFRQAKASELFYGGKKSAYCPAIADYYIAKKQTVGKSSGKPGDIVLFGFGHKNSQHIGIIEKKNANGTYTCIEGNTSTGNNCNGGMVMRRTRYQSQINWIVRPKYEAETVARKFGGIIAKPVLKKGSKGAEVKKLQSFLNWYGGYGLKVDGDFGNLTEQAVKKFQKKEGITSDGIYGNNSYAKARKY